jgi:DNA-binding SARP family transcriptional activator
MVHIKGWALTERAKDSSVFASKGVEGTSHSSAPALSISLLGGLRIAHRGSCGPARLTRAVQTLLAFLVLNRGRMHSREALVAAFWPDYNPKQALRCLSTALWRIRAVLEPRGVARRTFLLTTSLGEVGFCEEGDFWLDAASLEEEIGDALLAPAHAMSPASASRLEQTLSAHDGVLLAGFSDEWIARERERLELVWIQGVEQLMGYREARGEHAEVLRLAQRILERDPLREDMHRRIMTCCSRSGQRALAARQYRTCRELFLRELGVEPAEETQALYASIAKEIPRAGRVELHALSHLSDEIQRTLAALEAAERQLRDASRRVDELRRSEASFVPLELGVVARASREPAEKRARVGS